MDAAYRQVAARLDGDGSASVDEEGKLYLAALEVVLDEPSPTDLHPRVEATMPEVDLSEMWGGDVMGARVHRGVRPRLRQRRPRHRPRIVGHHSILRASDERGFQTASPGVPALSRDRLHDIAQHYVRLETVSTANVALIEAQARCRWRGPETCAASPESSGCSCRQLLKPYELFTVDCQCNAPGVTAEMPWRASNSASSS